LVGGKLKTNRIFLALALLAPPSVAFVGCKTNPDSIDASRHEVNKPVTQRYRAVTKADGIGFYVNRYIHVEETGAVTETITECGIGAGIHPIEIPCGPRGDSGVITEFGVVGLEEGGGRSPSVVYASEDTIGSLKLEKGRGQSPPVLYATEDQIDRMKAVVKERNRTRSRPEGKIYQSGQAFVENGGSKKMTFFYGCF
jgi:hypothetical protein